MKLEEYQAKSILERFGIPVPANGGVISKTAETAKALKKAGGAPWVLKAQVQTGGRGKAGGIRIAKSPAEARKMVSEMLGMKLVTAQTGPEGLVVKRLLVEKPVKIKREIYFSVVLDRKSGGPVLIASREGGMDIETLAHASPEKILKMPIQALFGLESHQARKLLFDLDLFDADPKQNAKRVQFFKNCVKAFLDSDASLFEINPLALTDRNELICLDAKIVVDDSALFRHPELEEYARLATLSAAEKKARQSGISYISLNGTIGCMVNGAGLAMATMDILKQHGGEPANFLDVGGGASVEQVTTAFKLIMSDKKVKAIFVNIFGGIMKCDVIAEGVIAAAREVKLAVPLVVRLQGNRMEEGQELLSRSGLDIASIGDLTAAAQKAVELSRKAGI